MLTGGPVGRGFLRFSYLVASRRLVPLGGSVWAYFADFSLSNASQATASRILWDDFDGYFGAAEKGCPFWPHATCNLYYRGR